MVLETRHFEKKIRNTLKVFKCGVGEEWRSVGPIMWEMKYKKEPSEEECSTNNKRKEIWCDFDRASSLICGNKMPTRFNRGFYCRSYCLLNMFRASLCPSSGAQEYYTMFAACGTSCCGFSSSWSGVELRVMRPVCRMLQHPAIKTSVASSWHFISTY